MIIGFLGLLLMTTGGAGLSKCLFRRDPALENGTALGSLLVILFLFIGGFLGLSFAHLFLFLSIGLGGLTLFWLWDLLLNRRLILANLHQRKQLFWLVPLALALFLTWYGLSRPIHSMPGVELHGLKAKLFLGHQGLGQWFYEEPGWKHLRNHYPPGFAQIVAYTAHWMGGYDHYLVRIVPVYYLVILLFTIFSISKSLSHELLASILVSALFLSQQFADLARYFYAEPAMLILGIIGVKLLLGQHGKYQIMGCMLLCSMGWIKNEGLVQAFFILLVWAVYRVSKERKADEIKKALSYPLLGLLAILPWLLVFIIYGLGDSKFDWAKMSDYLGNWDQHKLSLQLLLSQMFTGREIYGGMWFFFIGALLLAGFSGIKKGKLTTQTIPYLPLYGASTMLWLIFITFILHCSLEPEDHARAIWRLLMLPTIGAMMLSIHLYKQHQKHELTH